MSIIRAEMTAPLLVARMIQQCEVARCRLTRQETATVRVPDRRGEFHDDAPQVTITRAQLEAWTNHILAREAQKKYPRLVHDFLDVNDWHEYMKFRSSALLNFCLRETLGPEQIALTVKGVFTYQINGDLHRADTLESDWTLRYVCLTYRLFWA